MAMADLVIHETEDTLNQYPRAPPPSPEAQQRALGSIFEGALDLKIQDFAVALDFTLTQASDGSVKNSNSSPLSTVPEKGSPCGSFLKDDDEEDDVCFPGSPKKRICNSPCSFPEGYDTHLNNDFVSGNAKFSSSSMSHSKSSRHRKSPTHSNSPPLVTNRSSPPFLSAHQTSPYSIPPRSENGIGHFTPNHNHTPIHSYNPTLSPPAHLGMLSKSFDLHNVNIFASESEPSPSEMRTRRAYTLGASNTEDDSSQRRRKISLKRTKDERDSDLQFSFENFTSPGSSEGGDRLVVSPDTTAKKSCPPPDTPSLPLTFAHSNTNYIPPSLNRAINVPPAFYQPPITPMFTPVPTNSSIFNHNLMEQPLSLASLDSVQMMDTGDTSLRLDSLDSMDCRQHEQPVSLIEMDTQTLSPLSLMHTQPPLPCPQSPLRTHSCETRHSFVDNCVPYVHVLGNNDVSSLNFSKSL